MTASFRKIATIATVLASAGAANAQSMGDVPFTCDDGRIITVDFSGDTARVSMSMSVEAKPSGSGFLYEGPAGALSGQGDEIMWTDKDPVTCQAVPGGAELVGGTWELSQVIPLGADGKSVDAEDPTRHSLTFLADGAVALRADCNRGRGTWTAQPESQGNGGLTLGPVALTRKACAGDPFPQMASELDKAVAYRVEDGTLRIDTQDGTAYLFHAAAAR